MFPVQFPYFKNDVESPLPEEQTDIANTLKKNTSLLAQTTSQRECAAASQSNNKQWAFSWLHRSERRHPNSFQEQPQAQDAALGHAVVPGLPSGPAMCLALAQTHRTASAGFHGYIQRLVKFQHRNSC